MKKRVVASVLTLAMVFALMFSVTTTSFAATNPDPVTVTVTVNVVDWSNYGAYVTPTSVEVSSTAAESNGVQDGLPQDQVSVADVMYTLNPQGTAISGGWISMFMGVSSYSWGFAVNDDYPMDDEGMGTMATTTPVVNGDYVTIFMYSDEYWMDVIATPFINGTKAREVTVAPGEEVTVSLMGYVYMFGGEGAMCESVLDIDDEGVFLAETQEGEMPSTPEYSYQSIGDSFYDFIPLEDENEDPIMMDGDGNITFKAPTEPGRYLYAAVSEYCGTDDEAAGCLIPTFFFVNVEEDEDNTPAPAPEKDKTAKTGDTSMALAAMIAMIIAAGAVVCTRKNNG